MTTRDPITPATTVLDILARQAAEHREHARQRGIAAQDAKDPLTDAAHAMSVTRASIEDIREQIAALEALLRVAESEYADATARHADALAAHAHHEAEAQQAADIAESLDRIAKQMRGQAPAPHAEALAATGLMVEPPKEAEQSPHCCLRCTMGLFRDDSGTWLHTHSGEADCDEVDPPGTPDDIPPAPREPVATPPVPTAPAPDMTMPDLGISPVPLPPATTNGEPRHAAPRDSTSTGRMRALGERIGIVHRDEPAGEQQGDGANGGGQ